ncbi:MAG: radical SAM protein [Chloroflexi bacterium]|nr:radical SAM protein [Chloroflexota bacterium]
MVSRVLLVNPNRMKPAVAPIALDYLADALWADGLEVDLLDLCLAADPGAAIAAQLRAAQPDVVAVTFRNTDDCYYTGGESFLPGLRAVVDGLRAHTGAPIVLGGVGFSVMPEAVLDACGLNLGVVGDGEVALPLLATRLAAGEDPTDVPGLVRRVAGGWARIPPSHPDPAALPARRRALVDNRRYFEEGGQGGVETKRGCAMACTYCADPVSKGRRYRLRTPAQVADEVDALIAQGVDHLHTCDCEFNLPGRHARAVCEELIRRRLGERVRWYGYCSPVPFSPELATLMRRAGFVGVNFGVDGGSDEVLARLGRAHRAEDVRRTADLCRRAGLVVMYDLLLGGPGETPETVAETIDLVKAADPDRVGVSLGLRIYPGTPLAKSLTRDGDLAYHPAVRTRGRPFDPTLAQPVFYVSSELGEDPLGYVHSLIRGDDRFFFAAADELERNYNYNDNSVLVQAIRQGYRGAYWDILRRLAASWDGTSSTGRS